MSIEHMENQETKPKRTTTRRYCYVIMHGKMPMEAYTRAATARNVLQKMRDEYLGIVGGHQQFEDYMTFAAKDYGTWTLHKLQLLS